MTSNVCVAIARLEVDNIKYGGDRTYYDMIPCYLSFLGSLNRSTLTLNDPINLCTSPRFAYLTKYTKTTAIQ